MNPEAPQSLNICLVSKRRRPSDGAHPGFLGPISRGLIRLGHQVTVLPSVDGWIQQFETLHKQRPFDLVHSLDASGFALAKQRKKLGVAMVYDVDATHLSQIYSRMGVSSETAWATIKTALSVTYSFLSTYFGRDRKLLKSADAVFVHSPQQRLILERYYLYPDQRIFMLPFGLEVEDLSLREKSGELMAQLGLPPQSQTIVTVTDMMDFSELRNLLWAFERVAIKKPTARLLIVGDGPLRKQIEFEMLRLALGSRVIFVGDVGSRTLGEHIALADVFVNLSSRSSGSEQSLLEAMAQKKVIVGSEVSPIATVVEDGVDGFLIRPADTFTLSELLLQVFNDQIPVAQMGEAARQKVLNFFDSRKMINQTLQAYTQARKRFVTAHRWLF